MVEQPLSNALRIIFLIVTGTVHHFATTVPHEARKEESEKGGKGPIAQNVTQHDLHPSAVRPFLLLLEISKYSLWTLTILEGVCRLLQMFPESKASNFLLPRLLSTTNLYLKSDSQLPFYLASLLIIIGWSIRKACFAALGRHFTFTHTTLDKHILVTTGPYGIVRHPGYVGIALIRLGGICLILSPGSWARAIGAVPWPVYHILSIPFETSSEILLNGSKILVSIYLAHSILEQYALFCVRARREDETLYKKFGEDWLTYSVKVPWMFIPYII